MNNVLGDIPDRRLGATIGYYSSQAAEVGVNRARAGLARQPSLAAQKRPKLRHQETRVWHIMKRKFTRLSRHYAAALRKHVEQKPRGSLQAARRLGCEAVGLGLETLDVARMHARALATLEGASQDGIIKPAEVFFTEAISPIEKTPRAALRTNAHLRQLHRTLDRRTVALAATNRSLKQSIVRRKSAEEALRKSGLNAKKLLAESGRLQKRLQQMAHQILSAQEHKRRKISNDLQDEIAQTLLGINVRLVTLKQEAAAEGLQKEIACTRRLVNKSMLSIRNFAREFGKSHER